MIPLSFPIIWNSLHFAAISLKISIFFFISLTKSFFIDNNTTHMLQHTIIYYPSFPHSIILKLHQFCYPKHISISFFISRTKSSFLESNITNVIIQKIISTAAFTIFNLHIIYLTLPYILQTHSLQNTHTYSLWIFKHHVSQSVHIQDPYPTKYLHIIPIHIINTISHNIYIYIYIYFLLSLHIIKTYQTLIQEHITKALSYGRYIFIMLKALLMKGKNS